MDRVSETKTASESKDTRETIVDLLRSRNKKARFMTELYASLERCKINTEEADRALTELEAEGAVMIRDHFCADPHVTCGDLRVIALVEHNEAQDPQVSASRQIAAGWNKWFSEYVANHRCS